VSLDLFSLPAGYLSSTWKRGVNGKSRRKDPFSGLLLSFRFSVIVRNSMADRMFLLGYAIFLTFPLNPKKKYEKTLIYHTPAHAAGFPLFFGAFAYTYE